MVPTIDMLAVATRTTKKAEPDFMSNPCARTLPGSTYVPPRFGPACSSIQAT